MVGACLCIAIASAAHQQPVQAESYPDIIVTGERVPRTLRETSSSVAVVTSDTIDQQASPHRVEQLLEQIPNVQVTPGAGPTIRGQDTSGALRDLPAFLGGTRPRTTLVVDGRAVSFNEFVFGVAPVWDLERLEVFRTPQTTTQGRNSIAGAIFVHTNDPSFDWEGQVRAIAGDYRARHVSGVVSGPAIADELAFRLAGDIRKARPSSDLTSRIRGADPNSDEYGQLRFKLIARPKALPGARIELAYAHISALKGAGTSVQLPFRDRRGSIAAVFRTNVDSLTATIAYDPARRVSTNTILTFGDSRVRRFAAPGLGETKTRIRDWSAESVLDWAPAESLRLVGGVSHSNVGLNQFIDLSQLAGIGEFDDRQHSTGLFGELSWKLVPQATLIAGLRYQHDRQQRTGVLAGASSAIDLDYDRSFQAWLPKLSVAYEFSTALTAGVLIQRAFNPGGTSLRFDTGAPDLFEAETLWDYELFARASLAREKLTATANLFLYDIRDAQRTQPIAIVAPTGAPVTFADLFNVPKARTHGAEAALEWRPSRRLSAHAAIGLLATKITKASGSHAQLLGNEFQRAPHFTGSAALDWRPVDRLRLSAQVRRNSGYFSDDFETPTRRVGGATTLNARAEWNAGPVILFGYARNLFDKFAMRFMFSSTAGFANDPREVGVGIESRF